MAEEVASITKTALERRSSKSGLPVKRCGKGVGVEVAVGDWAERTVPNSFGTEEAFFSTVKLILKTETLKTTMAKRRNNFSLERLPFW